MKVDTEISNYIATLPAAKQTDMHALYDLIISIMPNSKLWFLDGRDESGKVVSNPNIGFGSYSIHYADGKSKEFYQIGLSANTTGISVYIMGISDRKLLVENFASSIGKASVTGYCIKFKSLKDIDQNVLGKAIRFGLKESAKSN
jgi:hypothetical protein